MLKRKKIKPITLRDVTIIDDGKLRKAITAASLGNAMEWFDFGVYGFVAYALGKVFFPGADPSVQMVAALATFSVPFLIRPLGGLFFGMLGDKYGRQKILAITIVIMSISTFCIGLIPSYASIGIWAPILLLLCKMAQGFSVGGEYTGASIFVAEYSPDRKRGFMGSWLDFGSIAGFVLGAGVVVLMPQLVSGHRFCCCCVRWRRGSRSAESIPGHRFLSQSTRQTVSADLWAVGWTSARLPGLCWARAWWS